MQQVVEHPPNEKVLSVQRPTVKGKFLYVGDEKFWVKGVTYGTFAQDADGVEQLIPAVVDQDFARIAENGFNVVRTYSVPPRWVLDIALKHGLRVMIGIPIEVPAALLDEPGKEAEIEESVKKQIRGCEGHPAIFCYTIGNEVAPSVVRWQGRKRIQRFLERLYHTVKGIDADALVTYVNFPTTEYLQLSFLDFLCFNVYLESRRALDAYVARLHNLADNRPLLLAELGLDSLRNGEQKQAETLEWQIRMIFSSGCCGAIVYSWTDEWYRWGDLVQDWNFGLTTRDRKPKLALDRVKNVLADSPFPEKTAWPRISVIVCSFNGAATLRDTLNGLAKLDYPAFEVIVVNDGSTDSTAEIAAEYPFRLINTENRGLSSARNAGAEAATGEIVAFIDDDAYPDPDWLTYLAITFDQGNYAGVGGPNLPVSSDGWKAEAVANAPGPSPVLLSDRTAEHIPGCNMAFRKDALEKIQGFDPIFRLAGDDVDFCWRIRGQGWVIGYAPSAVVWHHRRNSFRKYWRQQVGYGRAEALLEKKWPTKYNGLGGLKWIGRIYGKGASSSSLSRGGRVYHGVWGTAPFQSLYQDSNRFSLVLSPEWYMVVGFFIFVAVLTVGWAPLPLSAAILAVGLALPISEAAISMYNAKIDESDPLHRAKSQLAIFVILLIQPLARLKGRIIGGLTPWRHHAAKVGPRFIPVTMKQWRSEWQNPEDALKDLETRVRDRGGVVKSGGEYDDWDLEVRVGQFGSSRVLLGAQSYGSGRQLLRYRITQTYSRASLLIFGLFLTISLAAAASGAYLQSVASALLCALVLAIMILDSSLAAGLLREALKRAGAS